MLMRIIAVGKIKEKYLQKGVEEYLKRMQPYTRTQVIEIPDQKIPENASLEEERLIMAREGEGILKHLRSHSPTKVTVVLDRKGKYLSSEELTHWLEKKMLEGKSEINWIIGGSLGLDPGIIKQADLVLSFSKMTFPHQLMRMILVEQIYRCFKILRNEPYHR